MFWSNCANCSQPTPGDAAGWAESAGMVMARDPPVRQSLASNVWEKLTRIRLNRSHVFAQRHRPANETEASCVFPQKLRGIVLRAQRTESCSAFLDFQRIYQNNNERKSDPKACVIKKNIWVPLRVYWGAIYAATALLLHSFSLCRAQPLTFNLTLVSELPSRMRRSWTTDVLCKV